VKEIKIRIVSGLIAIVLLLIIILSYDRVVAFIQDVWMSSSSEDDLKMVLIFGLYLYIFPGGFITALVNVVQKNPRKKFKKYGYFLIWLSVSTLLGVSLVGLTELSGQFIARIFLVSHFGFFLYFFVLGSILELIKDFKEKKKSE